MEICEFVEKLLYGEASFTKGGGVWVGIYGGKNSPCKDGICKFCMPIAAMIPFDDGDKYRKTERKNMKTEQMEPYVWYRMTRKAHSEYTWRKKKKDGTPMFKSKWYKGAEDSSVSGRKKGNKQYRCNKCQKMVDIERDNNNNAYCCDCGTLMFS